MPGRQGQTDHAPLLDDIARCLLEIDKQLVAACSAHAVFVVGNEDEGLHGRLTKSYAANGFNVVQHCLTEHVIAVLSRLWDPPQHGDRAVASVPYLLACLRADKEVHLQVIKARRRESRLNRPHHTQYPDNMSSAERKRVAEWIASRRRGEAEKAGEAAHGELAAIEGDGAAIENSPAMKRLRTFRHKHLAHLDLARVMESRNDRAASGLEHSDIHALLIRTMQTYSRLRLLCDWVGVDLAESYDAFLRSAAAFWNSVRAEGKGDWTSIRKTEAAFKGRLAAEAGPSK